MNAIANCVQKIMRKIVTLPIDKNTILNSIAPIGNSFLSLRLCQSLHEKPQLELRTLLPMAFLMAKGALAIFTGLSQNRRKKRISLKNLLASLFTVQ
jgi:hypothetical protein